MPFVHSNDAGNSSDQTAELLSEAQRLYGDGVIYNMRGQWTDARNSFDEALRIVSQIDLEDDQNIADRVDALLREIAYDYRFTLSQAGTLTVESAPVLLSLALSEKPFSELTQQRLQRLMQELPEQNLDIPHDYPIVWNDRVKEKIVFFQTEARGAMTRWLGRSHAYLPMIRETFTREGLPLDIAYLPLIESGFNPNAYSWAHAVGIWQFIKGTARAHGLEVTWWLDERRDPEKSTQAAAEYLKKLYKMFGDWHLALAAYNCGEGRVGRTIKKQGTNDYWKLDLPTQTENYVPLFIAALVIAKNPEKYGFNDITPQENMDFDVVWVNEVVNLNLAARCASTSYDTLKLLNPELVRSCTPPKTKSYALRVPKGSGTDFVEKYKQIPESEKVAWHRHQVKKGESLWTIARRYGTSVRALMDANSIKKSNRLMPGQFLLIPVDRETAEKIASSSTAKSSGRKIPSTYKVKNGDTISQIALNLGISTLELMKENGLTAKSIIHPGQTLKVPGGTKTIYHAVKKGETLSEIALKYGIPLSDLLTWNGLTQKSILRIGKKLKIELAVDDRYTGSTSYRNSNASIRKHVVKSGESLWSIARKYGVTVDNIKKWNDLKSDRLATGRNLTIRGGTKGVYSTGKQTRTTIADHIVKSGESLWSIAHKYSIGVDELRRLNGLSSNCVLQPNQKLVIGSGKSQDARQSGSAKKGAKVVHTVRQGETLWQSARKYGTTVNDIVQTNNITDTGMLRPGDRITIGTH